MSYLVVLLFFSSFSCASLSWGRNCILFTEKFTLITIFHSLPHYMTFCRSRNNGGFKRIRTLQPDDGTSLPMSVCSDYCLQEIFDRPSDEKRYLELDTGCHVISSSAIHVIFVVVERVLDFQSRQFCYFHISTPRVGMSHDMQGVAGCVGHDHRHVSWYVLRLVV